MIKSIYKKVVIALILTLTVLNFNTLQMNAASRTKTVTTQAELASALQNEQVGEIIIQPGKDTTFKIGKKDYNKNLVVYQDKTTLVNNGKFNSCNIIVKTTAQATKAIENIKKYHRSGKIALVIYNPQKGIVLPKGDLQSIASLEIDNCMPSIKNYANWKNIWIKNMYEGEFTQYGNTDTITVTGNLQGMTIVVGARVKKINYDQKEGSHGNTSWNDIKIDGSLDSIIISKKLDMMISGRNSSNIRKNLINRSDEDITVYFDGEEGYYLLNEKSILQKYTKEGFKVIYEDENYYYDFIDDTIEGLDVNTPEKMVKSEDVNSPVAGNEDKTYKYKEYTVSTGVGKMATVFGYFDEAASYDAFLKVNELRASLGLNKLEWNKKLFSIAETRATDLVRKYSHTRPNGDSCFNLLAENGMQYSHLGENLAAGYTSVDAVMEAWKNSPEHYENMIHADYKSMIVGCIIAKDETDKTGYKYYWVQMFVG
ncbi:CAP domain-containing protein [Anaerocolumna xylanovorans]|uniref:Cysteine-rich secretory protein family protein n=1 Tax=Anaerocolumna xylanovorans DSM 12503 TaxID=1121345 RepID=A0A1M7YMM2_9FIRM|nr:CAP domain-containing protein [Anaerocolumna xylanovorans]SHO53827.1 Cysteine-rich secretory protein family protein [Anaerocolumna xylanovorans DSM 12503]